MGSNKVFDNMPLWMQIVWMAIKVAVVIFAIFQASNVAILYQGF